MKLSIAILAFSFNLTTINPSRHLDQDGVIGALDLLLNGVLANAMDAESVFHGYTGGWPVELHDATVHHIKLVRAAAWMTEDLPELTAEVLAVITPLVTLVSRTEVAFAENVAYTRSWFEEAGACEYMHDAIERLRKPPVPFSTPFSPPFLHHFPILFSHPFFPLLFLLFLTSSAMSTPEEKDERKE
ncbi:hypothetical protein F4779DRAFT_9860 [Xylariaceae sp. FL0662B]|nr:hypothetical protein F4779DRAFT_9860 [Xylariaceae sp. FL0662B]